MSERLLLFDVGNTRIKWGVDADGEIRNTGSIRRATLAERGMETLTLRLPRNVGAAIACNVAGADVGARFARAIGIHIGGDLRFVHSERERCGVVNGYRRPRTLGADRWAAMIGARAAHRGALCIVDAGTAVTVDAVDPDGRHLGGQIIPGLQLLAKTLASDTSDIGQAAPRQKQDVGEAFGDSTRAAVAAGAINAVCGAIDRAVKAMRAKGLRPKVVLTGGDASRILGALAGNPEHRPHLVLEGLARIARD